MENKSINLRPLPYGMGTMTITIHNNIEYKKMVALPDGRRLRKTVHGKSQIAKSKIAHFRFTTFLSLFFFICSCFLNFRAMH